MKLKNDTKYLSLKTEDSIHKTQYTRLNTQDSRLNT